MTAALLVLILVVSSVIVRLAAFVLELTGMPWDQAKFQALSAFSTTGFTTRESEQLLNHPLRRRVVATLVVLGNAGIVTFVGTFAGTIAKNDPMELAVDAVVMLVGLMFVVALMRSEWVTGRVRARVQRWMAGRYDLAPKAEEMLRLDEGYVLTRIVVDPDSPVCGKQLMKLGLKGWRVQVLAIERAGHFQPVPRGEDEIMAGDELVIYGPTSAIQKVFKPRTTTRLTIVGEGTLAPSSARESELPSHASEAFGVAPTQVAVSPPSTPVAPTAPSQPSPADPPPPATPSPQGSGRKQTVVWES